MKKYFQNLLFITLLLYTQNLLSNVSKIRCIFNAIVRSPKALLLKPSSSFEDLSIAWVILRNSDHFSVDKTIDARRLIDPVDWEKAVVKMTDPWNVYGKNTIQDWLKAAQYLDELYLTGKYERPNLTFLKKIHALSCENMHFKGYQGRRLLILKSSKLNDELLLTKEEYLKLAKEVIHNDKPLQDLSYTDYQSMFPSKSPELINAIIDKVKSFNMLSNNELLGTIRTNKIDELTHNGSLYVPVFETNGKVKVDFNNEVKLRRVFEEKEFIMLKENEYVQSDGLIIKDGVPVGYIKFGELKELERRVENIINHAVIELDHTKELSKKILIISQMGKDLISLHPFLDGNGRSIRLFMDYLYNLHKLPPPIIPNEGDLAMTSLELMQFYETQAKEYVNLKILKK